MLRLQRSARTSYSLTILAVMCVTMTGLITKADGFADDVMLGAFEGAGFGAWTVDGKAFGQHAIQPDRDLGQSGRGLASSQRAAEKAATWELEVGSLTSPEFVIGRDYLNFLIGGGNHAFRTAASLWVDGKIVRTSTSLTPDRLSWTTWDLRDLQGKTASIGVYDHCIEDPAGYVMVDQFTLSNRPAAPIGGDVAQASIQIRREAVEAIARNAPLAAKDPYRPLYHYTPPAQRMNDPNGPAWHNGYHHIFYQHMVFVGSGPARDVHWGHARSRDLVNWETLPLAIHPAYDLGELSCFSGNMAWDKRGEPIQFVTMVPYRKDTFRQIWPARRVDTEWIEWARIPELPPAGLVPEGKPNRNLKDAFPFSAGDRRFLVLAEKNVPIYEATNDTLTEWKFRGLLDETSVECPNFFEVDGKWIYLSSPHGPVSYVVGDFDPTTAKFVPKSRGQINHGGGFYASTAYRDDKGRTILHGVSRGQKAGKGWTGALAMPRVLTIADDATVRMNPLPEFQSLRRDAFRLDVPRRLKDEAHPIDAVRGDSLEILAKFKVQDAHTVGLRVRRSDDGTRSIPILWSDGKIVVGKEAKEIPCEYQLDPASNELVLHVFLDKGIIDVCVGDGQIFESRVVYPGLDDLAVEAFAENGEATLISLEAWQMAPARIDHSRLLSERQP